MKEDLNSIVCKAKDNARVWLEINEQRPEARRVSCSVSESREKIWIKPQPNVFKCNVSSSWVNSSSLIGAAWVLRDHYGELHLHSRDALTPSLSRMKADLRCFT